EPGGGTLFGDAACGSPPFDAAFRRFVTELLPNNPLVSIPRDDELYSTKVGFDLADSQYTKAATAARTSPSSRASRSTATGPSSIPSTTSAVPWNDIRGSTARATPTSRLSGSPPTSSSIPPCRKKRLMAAWQSVICHLSFAIRHPPSAIRHPPSAIRHLPFQPKDVCH